MGLNEQTWDKDVSHTLFLNNMFHILRNIFYVSGCTEYFGYHSKHFTEIARFDEIFPTVAIHLIW